jgi:hypothetical protein
MFYRSLTTLPESVKLTGMKMTNLPIPPPPPECRCDENIPLGARLYRSIFAIGVRSRFLGTMYKWARKFIPFPGVWEEAHVKSLVRKGYKPLYASDKIAVVVAIDWAIWHLEKILENLNGIEYDLIYINTGEIQCRNFAKLHNCDVFSIRKVIKRKLRYKLALTSHVGKITGGNTEFDVGIELIAEKLLFVASLADFSYCQYIQAECYDYIVCAGEYQRREFQKLVDKDRLFVIGSPRFDNYKNDKEAAIQIITRKTGRELCRNKKNILWLTTHSEITSCINFAPIVSKIQNEFNIIHKPHTFNYYEISDFENRIRSLIPEIIIINDVDSVKLIPAADFVICDYGGSVFSAIKADKNVLLFNTSKPELLAGVFAPDLPVNTIRDRIVNFYPDEEEKFFAALKDDSVWERQKEIRRQIRAEFFTDNPDPARDIAELCRRIVRGEL